MSLHLVKLCVGIGAIDELVSEIRQKNRISHPPYHITRSMPKRHREIIDGGGSLYWVIAGTICCRQQLAAIESIISDDGRKSCRLMLSAQVTPTIPIAHRPFRGWRYLTDPPDDLTSYKTQTPSSLYQELSRLGLR